MDEYRTAIRLKPDFAEARKNLARAHHNLGFALLNQGSPDRAIAEYRAAIPLEPDLASSYTGLGNALLRLRRLDEAIEACRDAIKLDPEDGKAHLNLGLALVAQRQFGEALTELKAARDRAGTDPEKELPGIGQHIAFLERQVHLGSRLQTILEEGARPEDNTERLALAQLCYDTKRFATAARFWAEALADDSKLGDDRQAQHRYNAACAAALAAAGPGKAEPQLDDAAKAKLRAQALDWLKADRNAWAKLLDSSLPQARALLVNALQHWKSNADLATVRDPAALTRLPEAERKGWQDLWARVDDLLREGTGGSGAKPAPPSGGLPADPFTP
jgi:tetratricopeptide (TPR) repeat protein